MRVNIIADIAGRYDELLALLAQMPEADLILSVGDMVDRGTQSPEVVEFFRTTPNAMALYGNHEDMMVQAILDKRNIDWMWNGGHQTSLSYDRYEENLIYEHVAWMQALPLHFKIPGLFVSHAPQLHIGNFPVKMETHLANLIWNRREPVHKADAFMVCGHNGLYTEFKDRKTQEHIGTCIDNSHERELLGMHWPTKEIFRQAYKEKKK